MTLTRLLTAETTPIATHLAHLLKDPSGTPLDRKVTLAILAASAPWATLYATLADADPATLAADPAFTSAFAPLGLNDQNVMDYGAAADDTTDDSAAIQAAIDATEPGGTVLIPAGNYRAAGLLLRDHVSIKGNGAQSTFIRPPTGATDDGVFLLPLGPVIYVTVEDINVKTTTTNVDHGFYLRSQHSGVGANDGGLWYSTFRNVSVSGFPGSQIWLAGGGDDFLTPHQFLRFENVNLFRKDDTASTALKLTGQVGQVVLDGCEIDGPTVLGAGTNIEISREYVSGSPVAATAPYAITFNGCTSQGAMLAVWLDVARIVTFLGCYFENNGSGIDCDTQAVVDVLGCYFSSSCDDGSGTGYGVRARRGARVTSHGCWFAGDVDFHYAMLDANITTALHLGLVHLLDDTQELLLSGSNTRTMASAATLNLGARRTAYMTNGPNVTKINSHWGEGNSVHLRTAGGNTVSYETSADLSLGGRTSPLAVAAGQVVTFTRFDVATKWTLTALSV